MPQQNARVGTTPTSAARSTTRSSTIRVPLEIKDLTEQGEFTAYLAVFGNIDSGNDRIVKGAFAESLRRQGPKPFPLLYQHDPEEVIGGFYATEDDYGLRMSPGFFNLETQRGREAYSNAKRGLLTGFSIGYETKDFSVDAQTGVRTLTRVDLWEGSIVTFPMNPAARLVSIKKMLPSTAREFEMFLRDAGFSRRQAKTLTSQGWCLGETLPPPTPETEEAKCLAAELDRLNGMLRQLVRR